MTDSVTSPPPAPQTSAPKPRGTWRGNLLVALIAMAIALGAIEIGMRLMLGVPLFRLADWRVERVVIGRLGERALVDPVLGWTLKPNNASDDHTTLAHGIRSNFGETDLRTGSILAVGDSFTEGWEVDDEESWPAFLEKRLARPVVNGGVGGYGTDQIVLRAEQLLPIVKPKVLIVGILEFDIFRAGHSHFGAPKPYFTVENGELRYHPPAPLEVRRRDGFFARAQYGLRDALGYSVTANHLLARLAPDFWYGTEKQQYHRVQTDVVQVTCLLLQRLLRRADGEGIRMIVFMQHYGPLIAGSDRPSDNAQRVSACAQGFGIQVIDQFPSLRTIAQADPKAFWEHYVTSGDMYTHMSAKGNEHAAELLAAVLGR